MRNLARVLLAVGLLGAGVAHVAFTDAYRELVPTFLPWRTAIVLGSGVVELTLAVALVVLRERRLLVLGWVVAAFFVAVFPGNLWQAFHPGDSYGVGSTASLVRLPFQPVLVVWALWCTGTWAARRAGEDDGSAAVTP